MRSLTGPGDAPPLLVGRSRERGIILGELHAALAGHGSLIILSGEAGIGKTTLAEDACRQASEAGALVLTGHCYDRTETPPYGPWVEILEQFHALRDQLPALRAIPEPSLIDSSSQSALFSEIRRSLIALAHERPLVILLEDLHWTDNASLDLLRVIARRLASLPVLLLATYRSDEVSRQHPLYHLLPVLVREALAVRIDLSPFGDEEVSTLIHHTYQMPDGDIARLVTYLQAHAGGNPFFLSEMLRSLEGTALFQTPAGRWTLGELGEIQVPTLLRQVIDARLARLAEAEEALLTVAAVIGEVVPLDLWARVTGTTEEALFPLLERAIEARILDAPADGLTVRFTHALIREAISGSILPPKRRRLHRRIAEVLIAQGAAPDPDEAAYHLGQAGDRRAVEWLTRAGERAQRAFAYPAAASRFQAALQLLEGDGASQNERGWLHFRLALLRRFQDPTSGIDDLTEAGRLGNASGDAALVAYAHFFRGMLRRMAGNFQQGIATAEEGIALLDALSEQDHARLAALDTTSDPLDAQNGRGDLALSLGAIGPFARAVTLGEQIVSLPPEETLGSRGDAYYGLGYAYSALGRPEMARSAFGRAREIFRADDYRSMVLATLFEELVLAVLPYQTDQPHERERLEVEIAEAFAALEDVFDPLSARMAGVVSGVLNGTWDDVLSIVQEGSPRYIRLVSLTLIAPLARYQGHADLAWSLVHDALPSGLNTAPADSAGHIVPLRALAVQLALDSGDLDAARQWLDAFDRWLAWSGGVLGLADAHLCWAAYHRAMGESALARTRAVSALAAAGAPRQPLALLAAYRLLGELDLAAGQLVEAEAQLAAALALADACGSRYERALTLLALADMLRVRGDFPAARAHLDTVRTLCTPMRAAIALAQADALEVLLLAPSPALPTVLPAGLTVREGEVLRLLATGLSNATIAQQLSLSPRTINAHLTSIYGKLGVTSRGAAIRFALDHDLG